MRRDPPPVPSRRRASASARAAGPRTRGAGGSSRRPSGGPRGSGRQVARGPLVREAGRPPRRAGRDRTSAGRTAPSAISGRRRASSPRHTVPSFAENSVFLGQAASAKGVDPWPEGQDLLALVAPPDEGAPALAPGLNVQLGRETALADAGLADQRDELAPARPRGLQSVAELRPARPRGPRGGLGGEHAGRRLEMFRATSSGGIGARWRRSSACASALRCRIS